MYEVKFADEAGDSINSIQWNICAMSARQCPDYENDYANLFNSNNTCNHLSEVLSVNESPGSFRLLEEGQASKGLFVTYDQGDRCSTSSNYVLTVEIRCNITNIGTPKVRLDLESVREDSCSPRVIMETVHGCPIRDSGPLYSFMDHYSYLVGANCMIIGFGMMGFGGMMPGLTLFILTTIIIGTFQLIILYERLLPVTSPEWSVWLACYFSFGMGAGLGVGAMRWPRLGVLASGATIGYCLGKMIELVLIQSFVDQDSIANIITMALVVVITMIFSVVFFDYAVIVCCCMIGSYVFFRVSLLIID